MFWQTLLATTVLSTLALLADGVPRIAWGLGLAGAFLCGTTWVYWAMTMVNRSLPAATTSLGIPAAPVVGVATSAIVFGEPISASLTSPWR